MLCERPSDFRWILSLGLERSVILAGTIARASAPLDAQLCYFFQRRLGGKARRSQPSHVRAAINFAANIDQARNIGRVVPRTWRQIITPLIRPTVRESIEVECKVPIA